MESILFESDYITISYDEAKEIISLTYHRKGDTPEYILGMDTFLKYFKTVNTNKFLVDACKMGVVSLEGQNHVKSYSLPSMMEHIGERRLIHAQILPDDIFVNYMASKVRENSSGKFVVKPFTKAMKAEAIEWMLDADAVASIGH